MASLTSMRKEKLLEVVKELWESHKQGNMRDEPLLEIITVRAFEKYPTLFSLKEFPEYVDGRIVSLTLLSLTKEKKLWGNAQSGWMPVEVKHKSAR